MLTRARLTPPTPGRSTLLRLRLLTRLQERWQRRVVVIVGGPGFGKTTLLAEALRENALAPRGIDLWLSCGPEDAAASNLASGLRAASGVVEPGGDEDVVAAVAEAVWRRAPHQVALVVDDVHELPAGSSGADLLARLLDALPANGHLVVAGRTAPPLPLARLDAHGDVLRLDELDLAFSETELLEFAALRGVDGDRVAGIEGWPALAELAASTGPAALAAFMWQEILTHLSDDRRSLLARLAHVGRFDDEIAAAVAGAPVDLDRLLADIPLVQQGADGERALHPLWLPVLAPTVTDEQVAEARRQAAGVVRARGAVGDAMRLLLAAGAWDDVRSTILDAFGAGHTRVPDDVLRTWFDELPDAVQSSPEGRLLGLLADPVPHELTLIAEGLDSLAEEFRGAGDAAGELTALVQLGRVAWWRERHDILLGVIARVLELDGRGYPAAGPVASAGRAILADAMADFPRVLAELDRIPRGALNAEWTSLVSWLRSMALLALGDPDAALPPAERARQTPWSTIRIPSWGASLHARWFTGHVDEVREELGDLVTEAQALGLRSYVVVAASQACVAHALAGDRTEARRFLDVARRAGADASSLTEAHISIAAAYQAVAEGDEEGAAATLEAALAARPLLAGLSASAHLRMLPLYYVLVPATRAVWDHADLGPSTSEARALARAVVRLRDGAPAASVAALEVPAVGRVRAHLPTPWLAHLAVALTAVDRAEGMALLEATWPATQAAVRGLAQAGDPAVVKAAKRVLARLPAPPVTALELRMLGPVELRRGGDSGPVDTAEWRRERVRSLLLYLVVQGRSPREQVVDALWPDLDAAAGGRNLRVTLTYLLRVLEPERSEGDASFYVRQGQGTLELHRGPGFVVDAWRFEALVDAAEAADASGSPSLALEHYEAALAWWRGDPLAGLYDEWARSAADRLRLRFVAAAIRAGELLLARGTPSQALVLAERALQHEPWSEPAHRLVVAAHLALGGRGAARRALEQYRTKLAELGATPDDATLMVERLLETAERHAAAP